MSREKRAAVSSPSEPSTEPRTLGRRRALQSASVVALGIGGGAVVTDETSAARALGERLRPSDESPLGSHGLTPAPSTTQSVLGALATGASITAGDGHRYALGSVFDVRHGGIPLVLVREDGVKVALELLRFDPARPAPGRNGALAVHVLNRGDGATATDESAGLAAMAVATILVPVHAPRTLQTLAERCARSPLGTFDIPA